MKKILTLLAIAIAGLISCKKEEDTEKIVPPHEDYLNVYYDDIAFPSDGGENSFRIESNTDWTITNDADWLTIEPVKGNDYATIAMTASASDLYDDRNTVITVKAENLTKSFTVTQKCVGALLVTKNKFDIPQEGGEFTIELQSNMSYEIQIDPDSQSWITEIPQSKALTAYTHTFSVEANPNTTKRDGNVEIIGSNGKTETVSIYQAEKGEIVLSKSEETVSAIGGEVRVQLRSNVDYEVIVPEDIDWVERLQSDKADELVFNVKPNDRTENREAEITVKDKNSDLSQIFTIKQDNLKTIHVATKGTLSDVLKENGIENAEYLKITGELNDVDFLTLNEMGKNNLMYLDISEVNITVIPNNAMNGTNLSYIILPKNLIEIGAGAFYGTNIKEINIPETVEIIGKSAFCYCDALSKANIPTKIKEMGSYVFYYCTSLQEDIIIPPTIESIGDYIFEGSAIQSVTFKKGETPISITYCMFRNCKSLSSVNFETGCLIQELESGCFAECTALSEITIPAEVSEIVSSAFRDCTSLKSVTFETGSKLTTIDGYFNISQYSGVSFSGAFKGCTSLSSITIPASVETIAEGAFYDCTSLKEVKFEEGSKLSEIGGRASYNDYDYNNHAGKKWFTAGAFENCKALTSITIPKGVMVIKPATFNNCSSLSEINFEKGSKLHTISGTYHFFESSTLDGPNPFRGCPLKIFDASNCTELTTLEQAPFDGCNISLFKLGTTTPPKSEFVNWYIGQDIGTTSYAILKVPDESVNRYKNSYWSDYFPTISGLSE